MIPDPVSKHGDKRNLPLPIAEYYGSRACQEVLSWESYETFGEYAETWLAIRFPGRVNRWWKSPTKTNGFWTKPGSEGCKLFVFDRSTWDGTTDIPILDGAFLTWAWSMEDALDSLYRAFCPFYLDAAYNGHP